MAAKFIIIACCIAVTTAASIHHNHPHVPIVEPTQSNTSPDLKIIETSRHSSNHIEHGNQDRTKFITETPSIEPSETLLRSSKNPHKNKRRPGPTPSLRRFRRPRSSEVISFVRPFGDELSPKAFEVQRTRRVIKEISGDVLSPTSTAFEVQRTRRDIKEITSVPPGELLTRKSLQNLVSFIAGLVGVFFGPFGPVLSAVITPYISDIVYALAGFAN